MRERERMMMPMMRERRETKKKNGVRCVRPVAALRLVPSARGSEL
jgi:hypothetical protein